MRIFIFALGLITGAGSAQAAPTYMAVCVQYQSFANLRSGPGPQYTPVGKIYNMTPVKIVKESGNWFAVTVEPGAFNDKALLGFVRQDLVREIQIRRDCKGRQVPYE